MAEQRKKATLRPEGDGGDDGENGKHLLKVVVARRVDEQGRLLLYLCGELIDCGKQLGCL